MCVCVQCLGLCILHVGVAAWRLAPCLVSWLLALVSFVVHGFLGSRGLERFGIHTYLLLLRPSFSLVLCCCFLGGFRGLRVPRCGCKGTGEGGGGRGRSLRDAGIDRYGCRDINLNEIFGVEWGWGGCGVGFSYLPSPRCERG